MSILHEDQYTFMTTSLLSQLFLERETFQRNVVEKFETHFMLGNFFFGNRAVYEMTWKNTVQPEMSHMTI
jgi:hypothetical protein